MSTAEADALAQMTQSDDVRKRGRGVIDQPLGGFEHVRDVGVVREPCADGL